MYNSVEEYFVKEYPHLAEMLSNTGAFWPKVKNNTISNEVLDKQIGIGIDLSMYGSLVYQASVALMRARMIDKIENPN